MPSSRPPSSGAALASTVQLTSLRITTLRGVTRHADAVRDLVRRMRLAAYRADMARWTADGTYDKLQASAARMVHCDAAQSAPLMAAELLRSAGLVRDEPAVE